MFFYFLRFSLIVDEKKFSKNVGIAQNPFIATTIKNILIPMNGANIIDNPKVGTIKTTITNPKVFNSSLIYVPLIGNISIIPAGMKNPIKIP